MKLFNKTTLYVLGLCIGIVTHSTSQVPYKKGFIIKENGDTVSGYISKRILLNEISFKSKKIMPHAKHFTPSELRGFYCESEPYAYESALLADSFRPVFAQRLTDGRVQILRHNNQFWAKTAAERQKLYYIVTKINSGIEEKRYDATNIEPKFLTGKWETTGDEMVQATYIQTLKNMLNPQDSVQIDGFILSEKGILETFGAAQKVLKIDDFLPTKQDSSALPEPEPEPEPVRTSKWRIAASVGIQQNRFILLDKAIVSDILLNKPPYSFDGNIWIGHDSVSRFFSLGIGFYQFSNKITFRRPDLLLDEWLQMRVPHVDLLYMANPTGRFSPYALLGVNRVNYCFREGSMLIFQNGLDEFRLTTPPESTYFGGKTWSPRAGIGFLFRRYWNQNFSLEYNFSRFDIARPYIQHHVKLSFWYQFK